MTGVVQTADPDVQTGLSQRISDIDIAKLARGLNETGWHIISKLLNTDECSFVEKIYDQSIYRNTISMARYNLGKGEYRYFDYPLPGIVAALRRNLYSPLSQIANHWNDLLGLNNLYPATHDEYIEQCRTEGQKRPTPLILKYSKGDYNCLHQDIYGEMLFPIQIVILLSEPDEDFSGGEFLLTEQRPRMQSRGHVVPLRKGDAIVFAVNEFPRIGKRGAYRVKMRHGVSTLRNGSRHTLGIIFHDAT